MALQNVGLSTHRWNNHIKSLLLLLFYPLIIAATYAGLLFVIYLVCNDSIIHMPKEKAYKTIMYIATHFIWVPYVLMFLYLLVSYMWQRNALNLAHDTYVVTRKNNSDLYTMLEKLCILRGLRMPKLFIQEQDACNAYNLGLVPSTYTIVLSRGLLESMNAQHIQSVLAQQLMQLHNGDTRLLFLVGTFTNLFGAVSNTLSPITEDEDDQPEPKAEPPKYKYLTTRNTPSQTPNIYPKSLFNKYDIFDNRFGFALFLIFGVFKIANIWSVFIKMLISRKRHFAADAAAIALTKNPEAMISALHIAARSLEDLRVSQLLSQTLFYEQTTANIIAKRIAALEIYAQSQEQKRARNSN